jgi:hypothetical protein
MQFVYGCGLITLRVCVLRPSNNARTIGAENNMGRALFMFQPFTVISIPLTFAAHNLNVALNAFFT